MAAVRTAGVATFEAPVAKPPSTHDPVQQEASTPMLREWSYRPAPDLRVTTRSSSLPSRPSPVGRSRTPVAFAVKAEETTTDAAAAMGGSRHPWLNAAAASAAAATAATISVGEQIYQQSNHTAQQQPQPVVATLVTNLACGLRSVYAGVAERIEDGAGHVQVVDPSTHEVLSLPPPPSALPDEHGLASPAAAAKTLVEEAPQPQAQQPLNPAPETSAIDELCVGEPDLNPTSSSALGPPSNKEDRVDQAIDAPRERTDTGDESINEWVLDEYDEATFHVENGKLVEVRVPVPSVDYEELYEEALEEQMGRRGIGCVRRPRRALPPSRRTFANFRLKEHKSKDFVEESPPPPASPPSGRSASERKIVCEDSQEKEEEQPELSGAGKNGGNGKARHPVLRWVQRRRTARQQRRERKIAEHQASRQQQQQEQEPKVQSTTTATGPDDMPLNDEEDRGYDASSSERSAARVPDPATGEKKASGTARRPRRSRSVPVRRRLAKSKSPKRSKDNNDVADAANSKRPKSKSPKRPKNFKKKCKKGRRKRNCAIRRRAVSLDDVATAHEGLWDRTDEEEIEADSFGRLKPLPTDPRPKVHAARSCPAAPITQVIRRTCSTAVTSCVATSHSQPPPFTPPHPVLAFAASATARVVGNLLIQQQQIQHDQKQPPAAATLGLLPLTKLLHGVPIPAVPSVSPEEAKAEAEAASPHVPPAEAFHKLPPLPIATSADENDREAVSDDNELATETQGIVSAVSSPLLKPEASPEMASVRQDVASDVDSLLEDITRVLDELEAYPGVEEPSKVIDEESVPSLAGTDTSSSHGSLPPPLDSPPRQPESVRRRVEMFESLCDTGVLKAPPKPKPHLEFNRGRSWTAPSAVTALPQQPLATAVISKVEQPPAEAAAEEESAVGTEVGELAVVSGILAPPSPSPSPSPSPLKVVFLGDMVGSIPGAADAARHLAKHHRRLRRRSSSDHENEAPAFEVWNGPGARGNTISFSHHATQSLFFSSDALYVLFWDMALDDPKTYPRGGSRRRAGSDHSDEEDEDDHFAAEEAGRRADRALERRADSEVSAWVDHLVHCLEERRRLLGGASSGRSRCSILPVAVAPAGADEDEICRRCDLLRCRLLRRSEERARCGSSSALAGLVPDLVFPGERGTVLRVGAADGSEQLRAAVETIARGRRREYGAVAHPALSSPHQSDADTISLAVRKIVHELKQEHKVVAVSHVVRLLQQSVECDDSVAKKNVITTIRSLSEEGEVLYFGPTSQDAQMFVPSWTATWANGTAEEGGNDKEDCLHRFVILSPQWLSSAISCILRRDIRREIVETRDLMSSQVALGNSSEPQCDLSSFCMPQSSCPVIKADDVRLLWKSMNFMREASDDIALKSSGRSEFPFDSTLFEYLEKVLVQSRAFLPLRGQIASSLLSDPLSSGDTPNKLSRGHGIAKANSSTLYLLPGLMTQDPPSDIWTYKAKESWNTTLCQSWLFHDGITPGTMERVIGTVLQDLLDNKFQHLSDHQRDHGAAPIRVHQVMVWRSAFILRIGMDVICPQTMDRTESVIEVFGHLADAAVSSSGPPCVATDSMGSSMRRLTVSAKGQAGGAGRKIWDGGLGYVTKSITRALRETQEGMKSVENEIVCPDCLSFRHPCEASTWKADWVQSLKQKGHHHIRCGHGHNVEIALVCGSRPGSHTRLSVQETKPLQSPVVPVSTLLDGVVVVGLWDRKARQIKNVGSGFIADREKGLIATASHILFDMQSREKFGHEFFGLKDAKVVIGVIPKSGSSKGTRNATAVFRYFAEIVAHDIRNCDACILRITTRFEEDVAGDGEGCGDQPEVPLKNNARAMKAEKLHQLKLTKKFELEEDVRILGYNQGGEGRLKPGSHVNRCADFARGYVCKKFKISADERVNTGLSLGFNPLEETVVMCPTISGHSGGPCVNQEGSVIGILSRADPADKQRCYLVPASEIKRLLRKAKAKCTMSPLDLYYRT